MCFLLPHHLLFPLIWRLYCLGVGNKGHTWLLLIGYEWFRNFLTKFRIFYQPSEPVGNWFNQFSTIAGCLYQPWGTHDLSLFGSHSSGLGIENRFFCLFPYSVRNFLTKFGIFLSTVWTGWEPVQPVQHHSWQPLSAMRNTCLSLSGSHSSGLGIENHFFCLNPRSFQNFLGKFGNSSQ